MMKHRFTKLLIVFVGLVFMTLVVGWFHLANGDTIYRTTFGFYPNELTVSVGDTVAFVNLTKSPIWPASDVHPTHGVYPAFDPQTTIESGESWSFTFERKGAWKFHDHVASQFVGTIRVYDESGDISFDCSGRDRSACWVAEIENGLIEGGVPEAFKILLRLHQEVPEFASSCHNYAHDVGLKAYVHFGEGVNYGSETSYCNAGFYHGFMEGMIDNVNQVTRASSYCKSVGERLSEDFPLAEKQCRHGIGHGVMEYFINYRPEMLINPAKMLTEAVTICGELHDEVDDKMRCSSGAFNVYRDFIGGHKNYQEYVRSGEMLTVCSLMVNSYEKEGCYWELAKLFYNNTEVTNLLETIDEGDKTEFEFFGDTLSSTHNGYLGWMTRSWSGNVGKRAVNDFSADTVIKVCDLIPAIVRGDCLDGVVEGAFTSSEPRRENETILPLCGSALLSEVETQRCFTLFQKTLSDTYDEVEVSRQCESLPKSVKLVGYCA